MPHLMHCIYASAAASGLTKDELRHILQQSRTNNRDLGITGVLLYVDGTFFQVLEGERDIVNLMCRKICADPRHNKITQIISESIPKRTFADWSMGFSDFSSNELEDLVGAHDFASWKSALPDTNQSRARKLLDAFLEGRWRMKSAELVKMEAA